MQRRYGWGAEEIAPGTWSFALWAPDAHEVFAETGGQRIAMPPTQDGWHVGTGAARAGDTYRLNVDGTSIPDPASRAQDGDVHAASLLVPPADPPIWPGRPWEEAVIFEMHVGLFTPEGTFRAAIARLPDLARMGITVIEVMPIAQFPGQRGWGYDGVLHYAPHTAYGTPDDVRAFVAAAHEAGLSVILDVVFNHFGPDGAWIHHASPTFFDPDIQTPWGASIAFHEPAVRRYFIDNALYWLREFGFDGFRFDAVDQIRDREEPEFLVELGEAIRAEGFDRPIHLTTEDNRNITRLHDENGPYDGEWNDDYHHCIHVLLTGETFDYYASFGPAPFHDLCLSLECGFVEQGQPRPPQKTGRGEKSCDLPWHAFVNFNQNHDQTGNRAKGERLLALADPQAVKVAHGLLLLGPFIPMLFMGEEAGETAPFQFFVDFEGDLADATRKGRHDEFPSVKEFPDPVDPATFERSRPYTSETAETAVWRDLTARLLALRHDRIVPLMKSGRAGDAVVERLGGRALIATWPFALGTLRVAVDFGGAESFPEGGAFRMEEGPYRLAAFLDA
ncbi:malto-oligosyltrehalose trehalohydrolase [Falsirhodobacter halotolerans]|uniref:malto-oligosyltrehalose trehalohydrolase n=1 Tax=Falsirhodobacter halotolerans TaxID=1146892 RepID=UPI001FD079B5|nr:malto-oligosyltrehalose trehalohydrolase [Falsirhodobacter halotolerans]MCJ8138246.1 malto-oligosyltrehalose trehalohydrolase [Falsirhodobacter halotolerans]